MIFSNRSAISLRCPLLLLLGTLMLTGCEEKAAPAMAAGTTVLGMIPFLGDDFFIGMAVTIMAGLTFASVLTLVVVPVLYAVLFKVPVVEA